MSDGFFQEGDGQHEMPVLKVDDQFCNWDRIAGIRHRTFCRMGFRSRNSSSAYALAPAYGYSRSEIAPLGQRSTASSAASRKSSPGCSTNTTGAPASSALNSSGCRYEH